MFLLQLNEDIKSGFADVNFFRLFSFGYGLNDQKCLCACVSVCVKEILFKEWRSDVQIKT